MREYSGFGHFADLECDRYMYAPKSLLKSPELLAARIIDGQFWSLSALK